MFSFSIIEKVWQPWGESATNGVVNFQNTELAILQKENSDLRQEIGALKDKLHRRNMLVKAKVKRIKELEKEVIYLKEWQRDNIKATLKEIDPEGKITLAEVKLAMQQLRWESNIRRYSDGCPRKD